MASHTRSAAAEATALPLPPELSGRVRDYSFDRKVAILRTHPLSHFVATAGHPEVIAAFARVHALDTKARRTDAELRVIGEGVARKAPSGDPDRQARTLQRITSGRVAFLHHAHRDRRRVGAMRQLLATDLRDGAQYDTLGDFVGVNQMPAYEGPGQVTRYIDLARHVLGDPLSDGKLTFSATLVKDSAGRSHVSDPFTATTLTPEMAELQRSILAGVDIKVAMAILGYTWYNDVKREQFWDTDVKEAAHNPIVRDIAVEGLRALPARAS